MSTSGRTPDVCVIGAGLAGALVAHELARRGVEVVVLEAGPRHDPHDRMAYLRARLEEGRSPWGADPTRDIFTNGGGFEYPLNMFRVKGVGGTTLHWSALSPRLQECDFQMRRAHGVADDWPITYQELEPYYGQAEWALGVAGTPDNPFASPRSTGYPMMAFPYSYGDELLRRGAERLGITIHHTAFARNTVPFQERPACQAFSTCASLALCPITAQYSADVHVALAERTGHATVIPHAAVRRLNVGASGRVASASYTGRDGRDREQAARLFVLAAHAVESARLLLLSTSSRFPDGLANHSGVVGKYFMEHPGVYANGHVVPNVFPYRIGFHTAETHQFAAPDHRDDTGAFRLTFLNQVGPTPAEIAARSGNWGAALEEEVRDVFGHDVGMHAFVEQLPNARNTVTLDPVVRDGFGDPVPRITWDIGPYEHATARRAADVMTRILDAAGARGIDAPPDHVILCGHQMGTCRMGDDPATSVVDRTLRAHDVPNLCVVGSSVFVTAGALNPSLTIAALALRLADTIARDGYR